MIFAIIIIRVRIGGMIDEVVGEHRALADLPFGVFLAGWRHQPFLRRVPPRDPDDPDRQLGVTHRKQVFVEGHGIATYFTTAPTRNGNGNGRSSGSGSGDRWGLDPGSELRDEVQQGQILSLVPRIYRD
jgi:hypothetical protein